MSASKIAGAVCIATGTIALVYSGCALIKRVRINMLAKRIQTIRDILVANECSEQEASDLMKEMIMLTSKLAGLAYS